MKENQMNRYEAIYKASGELLPYYKPFSGLLNDHEVMAGFLSNPKRVIDTPCFRQYRHPDGTVMGVEDWIREMTLYEFEPIRFVDEDTEEGGASYFGNDMDNCIPAFNEKQARALYLAHIATNTTDTMLAESIYEHFTEFIGKPVLKARWEVTKFDEFIPPCYWPDGRPDEDRFYTKDSEGLALFYFDFFMKYGFERGLAPVGKIPAEIEDGGNIYRHRLPFLMPLGIDSELEEVQEYDEDDEDEEDDGPQLRNPVAKLITALDDLRDDDDLRLLKRVKCNMYYADLEDPGTRKDIAYSVLDGLAQIFKGKHTNYYPMEDSLARKDMTEKDLEILTDAGLFAGGSPDIEKGIEDNMVEDWKTCLDEWVRYGAC